MDKKFLFIDFETYWSSRDYTLSKMGPVEYVRDPRFEAQLLGVRINRAPVKVLQGEQIAAFLHGIDWSRRDIVVVGHNLHGFDALVLSEIYGVKPYYMIDTLCLARKAGIARVQSCSHKALCSYLGTGVKTDGTVISDGKHWPYDFTPEERAAFMKYCGEDVEQCSENFYAMQDYFDELELEFESLTARMVTTPMLEIDREAMENFLRMIDDETEATRQKVLEYFHFQNREDFLKAIRSQTSFRNMMRALGSDVPMKVSAKKTETARLALQVRAYACDADARAKLSDPQSYVVYTPALSKTDMDFLAMVDDPDPRVACLVQARLDTNSSIHRSRAVRFLELSENGRPIPIMLQCYKAHTGRYAAGNAEGKSDSINFQNLSKRNPKHKAIRKAIHAPKGYVLVSCDSSQVEARVLAYMANQHDLLATFRKGEDPYCKMAERICGRPWEELAAGAKSGDAECKKYRNLGKLLTLSCLAGNTLVLTNTGWQRIDSLSDNCKVWDGESWVTHQGRICNGLKKTVQVDGISMTPDHLIYDGTSWIAAGECLKTPFSLRSVLNTGAEGYSMFVQQGNGLNTKSSVSIAGRRHGAVFTTCAVLMSTIADIARRAILSISSTSNRSIPTLSRGQSMENSLSSGQKSGMKNGGFWCSARAVLRRIGCFCPIFCTENQHVAMPVQRRKQEIHKRENIIATPMYVQTSRREEDYCLESVQYYNGAIHPHAANMLCMESVVLNARSLHDALFWNISYRFRDMMTRVWKSTALTTMVTMLRGIFGSVLGKRICRTEGQSEKCRNESKNWKLVYDIRNAGPNNRFLIKTNSGYMLVHNCGYGVGAVKVSNTLRSTGIVLSHDPDKHDALAKQALDIYRQTNANITAFWRRAQQAVQHLAQGGEGTFGGPGDSLFHYASMPVTHFNALPSIKTPSGYIIRYPNLRMQMNDNARPEYVYDSWYERSFVETRIYGGSCTENLGQSVAFFLLIWQAVEMAKLGVPLIGNIHDAWLACVPESEADKTEAIMRRCMSMVPPYLEGLPVACDAEVGTDYTIA